MDNRRTSDYYLRESSSHHLHLAYGEVAEYRRTTFAERCAMFALQGLCVTLVFGGAVILIVKLAV